MKCMSNGNRQQNQRWENYSKENFREKWDTIVPTFVMWLRRFKSLSFMLLNFLHLIVLRDWFRIQACMVILQLNITNEKTCELLYSASCTYTTNKYWSQFVLWTWQPRVSCNYGMETHLRGILQLHSLLCPSLSRIHGVE